jgi:YggT family protein
MNRALADTLVSVVNFVAGALNLLIIARILMSWLPISPWHPLVRVLRTIVDPILRPFRRILPSLGGIDFSPLVAIVVIYFISQLLDQIIVAFLAGGQVNVAGSIALLIAHLLENIIIVLGVLVLIRLLISLFSADPWHPLVMGIRSMTNLLVRPFAGFGRRGQHTGLDVPALVTLAVYVALYLVVRYVVEPLLVRTFS